MSGAHISVIGVQRLIVAADAARYYRSISRVMTNANMNYSNILMNFKVEWEAYKDLKELDEPKVPKVNDRDGDRKIIRWAPIFKDALSRTYGSKEPLSYILREESTVPDENEDPLLTNDVGNVIACFGESGSILDELIKRLPHTGPIFKNDNSTVYGKIEEAVRGTSCESTIRSFSRKKDGRASFQAILVNYAGVEKYRAIMKRRMALLQNIKWNGKGYALELHVSNHRQAHDDLVECSKHIVVVVPSEPQRVEYLLDSIACSDNTLQAQIGLIRASTKQMREHFERAASALIEVDPYRKSQRITPPINKAARVSAIDFSAGRGSTGVDLRWYPRKDFLKLPTNQKDELMEWIKTESGRELISKFKQERDRSNPSQTHNRSNGKRKLSHNGNNNWKRKFKKAIKTDNGLKTVMSALAEEQANKAPLVAALKSQIDNLSIRENQPQVGAVTSIPATSVHQHKFPA